MRSRPQTSIEIDDAQRDATTENADAALDALLSVPSSSPRQFGEKLRMLAGEYGCEWQPRHIKALVADLGVFAN